jgi:hypothetical protein
MQREREIESESREKHRPVTQAVGLDPSTDDVGRTDDAGGWSGTQLPKRQRGSDGFWRCDFQAVSVWFSGGSTVG